jgi:hypothetical protein
MTLRQWLLLQVVVLVSSLWSWSAYERVFHLYAYVENGPKWKLVVYIYIIVLYIQLDTT